MITEGNYLLNPEPAWLRVRACLDEVWYLEAPSEPIRVDALIQRHERFGKSPEHARSHTLGSDQANAELIAGYRASADLQLRWPAWLAAQPGRFHSRPALPAEDAGDPSPAQSAGSGAGWGRPGISRSGRTARAAVTSSSTPPIT